MTYVNMTDSVCVGDVSAPEVLDYEPLSIQTDMWQVLMCSVWACMCIHVCKHTFVLWTGECYIRKKVDPFKRM